MPNQSSNTPEFCTRADWLRIFGMNVAKWDMGFPSPGLRFRLGLWDGAYERIEQFVSALDRARKILDCVFPTSRRLTVMFEYYGERSLLADREVLRATRDCIRRFGRPHQVYVATHPDQIEDEVIEDSYTRILFTIQRDLLVRVLWGPFAKDLGIGPQIPGWVYIADKELGIVAKPYDDRGMDVAGPNRELLQRLYREFNDWLLDSHRE